MAGRTQSTPYLRRRTAADRLGQAIAKYKLVDLLRRRAKRELLTDPLDEEFALAAAAETEATDARRDLAKLLAQLPDRQRLPIVHMKLEGLSVAEAGKRSGHVGVGGQSRRAPRHESAGGNDQERRMRTDDLVTMLATGAGAVQPNQAARRFASRSAGACLVRRC